MSLDTSFMSKNPSVDLRTIYQVELIVLYCGVLGLIVYALLQVQTLLQTTAPPAEANVQQVQIQNALQVIDPGSN